MFNNSMKKLLTMMLLLYGSTSIFAQNALVVHQKSGERVVYLLNETPKTHYSNGQLILSTAEVTVEYPLANLSKFTFEDVVNSITTNEVNKGIKVSFNQVLISGEKPFSSIIVASMSGTAVESIKCDSKGNASISLDALATGTYIIKSNSTTYKVNKK